MGEDAAWGAQGRLAQYTGGRTGGRAGRLAPTTRQSHSRGSHHNLFVRIPLGSKAMSNLLSIHLLRETPAELPQSLPHDWVAPLAGWATAAIPGNREGGPPRMHTPAKRPGRGA